MRFKSASSINGPFSLNPLQQHKPNCLCCIGQPDPSFEKAIDTLTRLDNPRISGLTRAVAESFIRLCRQSANGMRLSKSKVKVAMKLKMKFEAVLFTSEEIERMQAAVLDAYEETLVLEEEGEKKKKTTSAEEKE
jgi:hypothetical protein